MERNITIEIPESIYNKIKKILAGSDFQSVQEFVLYVLNDLTTTGWPRDESVAGEEMGEDEVEKIKKRLRNLGYL